MFPAAGEGVKGALVEPNADEGEAVLSVPVSDFPLSSAIVLEAVCGSVGATKLATHRYVPSGAVKLVSVCKVRFGRGAVAAR